MLNIRNLLAGSAMLVCFSGAAFALPSITIAPGSSPAGGYLPLSLFGITPIAGVGDNTETDFTVPAFNFAGSTFTSLGMDSNGYLIAGGGGTSMPVNLDLPNAAVANIIAPFWTDLDPTLSGALRIGELTDGVSTWIVADWQNVALAGDINSLNSFEVWLGLASNGSPNDVTFAYGPHSDPLALTIGAEDASGTVADAYYYNGIGSSPRELNQLRVTWDGLPVQAPEPGTIALLGGGLAGVARLRRFRKKS